MTRQRESMSAKYGFCEKGYLQYGFQGRMSEKSCICRTFLFAMFLLERGEGYSCRLPI